jgi:hypothetical protein
MSQTLPIEMPTIDRQIVYSGITWQQFKLIQSGFADSPGIRLFTRCVLMAQTSRLDAVTEFRRKIN